MLAMVNTGPDTNGSQFIIFLSDHSARLPKRYTTFGQIVGGMDVADAIGASAPIGGTLDAQPIIQQVIISELDDNSGS